MRLLCSYCTFSPYQVWGKVIKRDREKGVWCEEKESMEQLSWVEKLIVLEKFLESSCSIECPSEICDYKFEVSPVSIIA